MDIKVWQYPLYGSPKWILSVNEFIVAISTNRDHVEARADESRRAAAQQLAAYTLRWQDQDRKSA